MRQMLQKTFKTLGLSTKERDVLLCLFESSSLRASSIARQTNVNRTTLYGVLNKLRDRGLVSSFTRSGVNEYQSIQPNLLPEYIERQQAALEQQKKNVESHMIELIHMKYKGDHVPKIQLFEGVEGVKQAYEDTIENNKEKILLDFTDSQPIYEQMGKAWAEYYFKKRVDLGVQCNIITPRTPSAERDEKRDAELIRNTMYIPSMYRFETEIDIYDDKVAFFTFSKSDKPIAVIIQDKSIANSMKTLFSYISDQVSRPIDDSHRMNKKY